jgi:wyosine [tRNA(Phe)-imidazoG37] synthetase (radical SAM superfamily)
VRKQIAKADLIIPSLDAGSASVFDAINRPAPEINFETMLDGLIRFRAEFSNPIWLEILLLDGINSDDEAIQDLIKCVSRIAPDRIQINTATRPPADPRATPVAKERLDELARRFRPAAEVIADYRNVHAQTDFQTRKESVLDLLDRRPCTLDDITGGLGIHRNEAIKYVEELTATGQLAAENIAEKTFYKAIRKEH